MFFAGLIPSYLALLAFLVAMVLTILALLRKQSALPTLASHLAKSAFILQTIGVISLVVMLVLEDYTNYYVASVVNPAMPGILKVTALWGGQAGSLFFWSWLVSLIVFIALSGKRKLIDAWSFLVLAANVSFFLGLSLFGDNPFVRIWALSDGSLVSSLFAPEVGATVHKLSIGMGLNPLLRHPGMIIHPPMLYVGYALFFVPFAVGISTLIQKQNDDRLIHDTRTFVVLGWVFLTGGIVLGSWWSYDVLGWGGYWAWDPVETASLLPWLTATALLHSFLLERKRGIFKRFNFVLVLLTYLLVIFSIFVTRSGLVNSVHAFSESTISSPLLAFMCFWLVGSIGLLVWRWKALGGEFEINSPFSREAFFLYTNIILLALTAVCLWGLIFPLINGALTGNQVVLDRGYYDRTTTPLFLMLVFILAICPLIGWNVVQLKKIGKKLWIPLGLSILTILILFLSGLRIAMALGGIFLVALGLFTLLTLTIRDGIAVGLPKFWGFLWRQRNRYGAWLVHAGILLIALGIVGMETLSTNIQGTMLPQEKMPMMGYEIEFNSISETFTNPEYMTAEADTTLYKDGKEIARLFPAQHIYPERGQFISVPAVDSNLSRDVYLLLVGYDVDVPYITLRMSVNPLVNFMWLGGIFLVLGGLCVATTSSHLREEEELVKEEPLEV
jgi:cytochrome c-type biogenesis protein CcmF